MRRQRRGLCRRCMRAEHPLGDLCHLPFPLRRQAVDTITLLTRTQRGRGSALALEFAKDGTAAHQNPEDAHGVPRELCFAIPWATISAPSLDARPAPLACVVQTLRHSERGRSPIPIGTVPRSTSCAANSTDAPRATACEIGHTDPQQSRLPVEPLAQRMRTGLAGLLRACVFLQRRRLLVARCWRFRPLQRRLRTRAAVHADEGVEGVRFTICRVRTQFDLVGRLDATLFPKNIFPCRRRYRYGLQSLLAQARKSGCSRPQIDITPDHGDQPAHACRGLPPLHILQRRAVGRFRAQCGADKTACLTK